MAEIVYDWWILSRDGKDEQITQSPHPLTVAECRSLFGMEFEVRPLGGGKAVEWPEKRKPFT